MGVYRRGKTWWYRFNWHGETIRESTKQQNKRVAEQMEAARKTALAKGEVGIRDKKPPPTLEAFAEPFMAAIEAQCDKSNTIRFYRQKLGFLLQYEALAGARLDRIDERLIDTYKQDRSKRITCRGKVAAPASVNRELATLRRLLHLAHEWRLIDRVPRVRLLRGERVRDYVVTLEHERLYFDMARADLHDVALLLLEAGLRISEAVNLDWAQVKLKPASGARYGYLTVRAGNAKNSKARNVPLTQRAVDMLASRAPQKGLVFHRPDGRPLNPTVLDQQHARLRRLLKLPEDFVLHSFRHSFGTRLGEAGAGAFEIMQLMGHASVVVSQRYVHPTPETLQNAVERMERLRGSSRKQSGVGTNLGTVGETTDRDNRITH